MAPSRVTCGGGVGDGEGGGGGGGGRGELLPRL
jgi:hypothetical protein